MLVVLCESLTLIFGLLDLHSYVKRTLKRNLEGDGGLFSLK